MFVGENVDVLFVVTHQDERNLVLVRPRSQQARKLGPEWSIERGERLIEKQEPRRGE
jgi:hypothetical protein